MTQGIFDRPDAVIFLWEIREIINNFDGKKNHFLIKLDTESIHMKCDDQKEKEKWYESITGIMAIYKGKKMFDWDDDRTSHKEELDVRVVNLIMDEQEGKEWLKQMNTWAK